MHRYLARLRLITCRRHLNTSITLISYPSITVTSHLFTSSSPPTTQHDSHPSPPASPSSPTPASPSPTTPFLHPLPPHLTDLIFHHQHHHHLPPLFFITFHQSASPPSSSTSSIIVISHPFISPSPCTATSQHPHLTPLLPFISRDP